MRINVERWVDDRRPSMPVMVTAGGGGLQW